MQMLFEMGALDDEDECGERIEILNHDPSMNLAAVMLEEGYQVWQCLTVSRRKRPDSRTKIDNTTLRLYLVF